MIPTYVRDGWHAVCAQLGDRQVALPLRAVSRVRAQLAHSRQLGMLAYGYGRTQVPFFVEDMNGGGFGHDFRHQEQVPLGVMW